PRLPQDHNAATFAFKLAKQDGLLDFGDSAEKLDRLIRGLNPWPGAYARIGGEEVKIWQAKPRDERGRPGEILAVAENSLIVGCGEGALALEKVQRPNSRVITGVDLANGLRWAVGDNING
ncbi:MAG TPA: methionyl-tRNA formyltransferase, partial [Firmicutes bacterium]|nr:methionyl-tRNA formyltransferase [Bacillota bacterium]